MNLTKNVLKLIPLTLILMSAARAQNAPADIAHRFPGYEPTVVESEARARELFDSLDTRFKTVQPLKFRLGTECTQRAQTWSYDLHASKGVRLQKVFVFYTLAYHDYYAKKHGTGFKWWFHVSPYILVKTPAGTVEERTMDRSFADAPQTMKQWTDLFIESGEACVENVPFHAFEGDVTGEGPSHNPSAHCYIVRAPMYDMLPEDIEAREKGHKTAMEWDRGQVWFGAKALTAKARKEFLARVGF